MNQAQLEELAHFVSEDAPVLSLYLNVDPARRTKDKYRLWLRKLLKTVDGRADAADITRVEQFFEYEYNWQGKGVICFSCVREGLWVPLALPLPVADNALVDYRPCLRSLVDLASRHKPYAVIQVDRSRGRFVAAGMGELIATETISGEETKHHKQGGWAAQRLQRHDDEQAGHNLRSVVAAAESFIENHHLKRIVIAGTEENTAQFIPLLSRSHQEMIIDTLPLQMSATPQQVIEASQPLVIEVDAHHQTALIEELLTRAAKNDGAVVGSAETLLALQEERIQVLVASAGYATAGYVCKACTAITLEAQPQCPYCGGELRPVNDVVEAIVRRMLRLKGTVETVPAGTALDAAGGMGALLRY